MRVIISLLLHVVMYVFLSLFGRSLFLSVCSFFYMYVVLYVVTGLCRQFVVRSVCIAHVRSPFCVFVFVVIISLFIYFMNPFIHS